MNLERTQDARRLSSWVAYLATEDQLVEASALLDAVRQELPLFWSLVEPAWEERLANISMLRQVRRGVEGRA